MKQIIIKIERIILSRPYLWLVSIGILVRFFIAWAYGNHISIFADTGSYTPLAERLQTLDLAGYNGWRTPGYPLLLMLTGLQFKFTVFAQMVLGIGSSLLVFSTSYRTLKNTSIAFLCGLSCSFFLHILFYERSILTETLTLFCLSLALWYLARIHFFIERDTRFKLHKLFIAGLLVMMTFLVRPMFIVLVPLIATYHLILQRQQSFPLRVLQVVILCLPAVMAYQGWSTLNYKNTGYKSITAFSGINLGQNCVSFIEKSESTDRELTELYIRKRDSMIAYNGDVSMSIWRVYGELKKTDAITVSGLSQRLDPITKPLIKNNPIDYFKQVMISWRDFWKETLMWYPKEFESETIKNIFMGTWLFIQMPLNIALNVLFLVIALLMNMSRIKTKKLKLDFEYFLVILIVGSSVGQALVIYGNNNRFSIPFLPFIVLVTLHFVYKKWHFYKRLTLDS